MNYSDLSDLYGAEPDEILLFSQDTILRDLYGEALSNNIYIDVSEHPLGHYVVRVEEKTTPTALADMIVKSEFVSEDVFTLEVPDYINLETLRVMIYKRMKPTRLNYSVGLKGNLFFAKKRELINKIGSIDLDKLFVSLTLGSSKKLDIKNISNLESTLTRVYSKAKETGVTIKINVTEENIIITKVSNSRNKSDSYFSRFYEWLKSIELDVKCKIPDDLLTNTTTAYIKTVISKSGFDCKYSKGWVTKVSVALRRKAGKIDLCAGGRVLRTFDTVRVCHLTRRERALINLLIKPYGKSFEDL